MKARYYYTRDDKNRPVKTTCFVFNEATYARGIAVCFKTDNPCKKEGRRRAFSRAMTAFYRQTNLPAKDGSFMKGEFMPLLMGIESRFMTTG